MEFIDQFKQLEEQALDPSPQYVKDHPDWKNDLAQKWRMETGIELIYNEPNISLLNDIWNNWQQMPSNLKRISDEKSIELFGLTNKQHYAKLIRNPSQNKFYGYRFILHRHNPRQGSIHGDLRFLDLKNNKLLHSFAVPKEWLDNTDLKSTIYKTRDHDPRWLDLKSYRLETIDEGYVDYKMYRPSAYFDLEFHGKILNTRKILFKLKDRYRDDIWMIVNKKG